MLPAEKFAQLAKCLKMLCSVPNKNVSITLRIYMDGKGRDQSDQGLHCPLMECINQRQNKLTRPCGHAG